RPGAPAHLLPDGRQFHRIHQAHLVRRALPDGHRPGDARLIPPPLRRRPKQRSAMSPTGMPADLIVVGDTSIDHYVQVPHLASSDNKAIGRYLGTFGGGMCANLAAAAAHGAPTRLITKVGNDAEGAAELRAVTELGVDTSFSVHDPDHRTWMCFVQLDATGEKALVGADTGIKVPHLHEIDPRGLDG